MESVSSMVADVFREAKDAPTSFEPEQWLEGFEDARQIIAERIASKLTCLAMFDKEQFLVACDIDTDEEPDTQSHCGACGRLVGDHNVGEYDDECTLPPFTDEEKADQKHNAQMLDGCETEDEINAELRAQTQGDA